MVNPFYIWLIVLACSLVQSAFGVGLLIIGTPLLRLAGVPFHDALWVLLPASLTISLLQVGFDRQVDRSSANSVARIALPALAVGVSVSLMGVRAPMLDLVIAALLVLSAAFRVFGPAAVAARRFSTKYGGVMLAVIGFVHGLSNMGGSLLPAYAGARHQDKLAIRQTIAMAYALFAATQLVLLSILNGVQVGPVTVLMTATAGLTFLAIGRRVFHRLAAPVFAVALTVFMLGIAMLLVVRNSPFA